MNNFDVVAKELSDRPGRYGLTVGEKAGALLASLAQERGTEVLSVGKLLTQNGTLTANISGALTKAEFLVDLDILFAPQLALNPLDLLRDIARRQPVLLAAWPGWIERDEAFYSEPGRRDYYRSRLENVLVLRPRPSTLPGLLDFDVERFQ